LDVRDLRYFIDLRSFIAVYDSGSFSLAAAALRTVQSNISTRIKNLEEQLGTPLFERRYRRVLPTEAARRLYPRAAELLATLEQAVGEVRILEGGTDRRAA
jgi:DNA-binding transcriptional LysR family regulator